MSIAGKWGAQKRKGETVVPVTSSSRDAYCLRSREEVEKAKQEPIARFRDTRLKNPMLLTYSKAAHMDESSSEDFKELNHTTTSRSMNEWIESSSPSGLQRTLNRQSRLPTAPPAYGRSGKREENMGSQPGLIGEKLSLASEPSKNSLVQRSWMYCDDPALMYRTYGMPEAEIPEEGLPIGRTGTAMDRTTHTANHGRKAMLTGDVLTRASRSRAGIFLDDNDYKLNQLDQQ